MSSRLLGVLTVFFAIVSGGACSQHDTKSTSGLLKLTSWTELSDKAQQLDVPIVLLVEQRHCGYCQALKRDLIRPLASDPEYSGRALFVSVLTDFDEPWLEKNGVEISGFDFAQSFDASTTPTVLFLNQDAVELQERTVGYVADDEYKFRLLEKIEAAIGQVKAGL